jgi:hypothetical protein
MLTNNDYMYFTSEVLSEVPLRVPHDLLHMVKCCVGHLNCVSASVLLSVRQLRADMQTSKQVMFLRTVKICIKVICEVTVWMIMESS